MTDWLINHTFTVLQLRGRLATASAHPLRGYLAGMLRLVWDVLQSLDDTIVQITSENVASRVFAAGEAPMARTLSATGALLWDAAFGCTL